jgi:sulfoxide reductase catalytic subunit YedY
MVDPLKEPNKISASEITDPAVYFNRRTFIRAGILATSAVATGLVYRRLNPVAAGMVNTPVIQGITKPAGKTAEAAGFRVDEPETSLEDITHYNNFYEFSTDKEGVAPAAANFETKGWQVTVEGLVRKPRVFDLDDLLKISPPEERIYRMRCVEAWSMVIPWVGFSLSKLLDLVEPLSDAKYVAFETLLDPKRMPGQRSDVLNWPYVEGLRMDEAMHPLTLLASGLYGRALPPQDGAPIRLVVPWKYGFKGIKSIVKIKLVATQPRTTWSENAPNEYGFYANVNPHVDHPRWSQATEQRIGESSRRPNADV